MYPYGRINTYRVHWRGWFSAALPWVFVAAVVAGTMLPLRHWPAPASTQAARDSETIWKHAGNPDVRHPVDVIRTIDGDTFEARVHLEPGLELTTRVRLRGIDAPELKASCARELRMAEAAGDALRGLLDEGGSRSTISVPTNITDGSSPMSRPGERRMYRTPCLPAVMSASMTAATVLAGARMLTADSNQKSSAAFLHLGIPDKPISATRRPWCRSRHAGRGR